MASAAEPAPRRARSVRERNENCRQPPSPAGRKSPAQRPFPGASPGSGIAPGSVPDAEAGGSNPPFPTRSGAISRWLLFASRPRVRDLWKSFRTESTVRVGRSPRVRASPGGTLKPWQ
jgi:hypothetical protein